MPLTLEGITKEGHDEACVTYATLILNDAGLEVTAENIEKIVKASGNSVESYWPSLFAGIVAKGDLNELIGRVSAPGSGGNGGGAGGAGGADGEEEEVEEEEEEEEEGEE